MAAFHPSVATTMPLRRPSVSKFDRRTRPLGAPRLGRRSFLGRHARPRPTTHLCPSWGGCLARGD
eukprot:2135663-Pyramimonas_sp.AAC.1